MHFLRQLLKTIAGAIVQVVAMVLVAALIYGVVGGTCWGIVEVLRMCGVIQ